MITNLQELILSLNETWLSKPLATREQTKVCLHFNGFDYEFKYIRVSEDGSLSLWVEGD